MCEPNYQELVAKDVPLATDEGVKVKVIAGESLGVKVRRERHGVSVHVYEVICAQISTRQCNFSYMYFIRCVMFKD